MICTDVLDGVTLALIVATVLDLKGAQMQTPTCNGEFRTVYVRMQVVRLLLVTSILMRTDTQPPDGGQLFKHSVTL